MCSSQPASLERMVSTRFFNFTDSSQFHEKISSTSTYFVEKSCLRGGGGWNCIQVYALGIFWNLGSTRSQRIFSKFVFPHLAHFGIRLDLGWHRVQTFFHVLPNWILTLILPTNDRSNYVNTEITEFWGSETETTLKHRLSNTPSKINTYVLVSHKNLLQKKKNNNTMKVPNNSQISKQEVSANKIRR